MTFLSEDARGLARELAQLVGTAFGTEQAAELPAAAAFRGWVHALLQRHSAGTSGLASYLLRATLTMAEITYRRLLEPPHAPDSALLASFEALLQRRPPPRSAFAQSAVDPASSLRRALEIQRGLGEGLHSVLFVGDDDATSIALALLAPTYDLWALDLDERVLDFLRDAAAGLDCPPQIFQHDIRFPPPFQIRRRFSAVVTDPPCNAADCLEFLRFSAECLGPLSSSRLFWADHPAWTIGHQEVLAQIPGLGLVCQEVLPELHRYPLALDPEVLLEDLGEWDGVAHPGGIPLAVILDQAALDLGLPAGWLSAVARASSAWSHLYVLRRLQQGELGVAFAPGL